MWRDAAAEPLRSLELTVQPHTLQSQQIVPGGTRSAGASPIGFLVHSFPAALRCFKEAAIAANIFSFCSPLNPAFLYSLSETAISPTPPPHRCPQEKAISISKQISDGRTHILNPVSCLLKCWVTSWATMVESMTPSPGLRKCSGCVACGKDLALFWMGAFLAEQAPVVVHRSLRF